MSKGLQHVKQWEERNNTNSHYWLQIWNCTDLDFEMHNS